jgi:hypothetical protein
MLELSVKSRDWGGNENSQFQHNRPSNRCKPLNPNKGTTTIGTIIANQPSRKHSIQRLHKPNGLTLE